MEIRLTRLLLLVGAIACLALGLAILLAPDAFYAGYGITPSGDVALLSELKAAGGMVTLAGLVIGACLVRSGWRPLSLAVGVLVFLGFGLGRVVAMLTDGMPPVSLMTVTGVEVAIGVIFALAFWRQRQG